MVSPVEKRFKGMCGLTALVSSSGSIICAAREAR